MGQEEIRLPGARLQYPWRTWPSSAPSIRRPRESIKFGTLLGFSTSRSEHTRPHGTWPVQLGCSQTDQQLPKIRGRGTRNEGVHHHNDGGRRTIGTPTTSYRPVQNRTNSFHRHSLRYIFPVIRHLRWSSGLTPGMPELVDIADKNIKGDRPTAPRLVVDVNHRASRRLSVELA
jgi:hypothetical protein